MLALTGPPTWPRVLTIAERTLEALLRAYTATRTAHRALTPARCIIDADDAVVLTDYGWVEIAGTNAVYRAPEQQSTMGDEHSDVYTLTMITYEAIARKRPRASRARTPAIAPVPFSIDALFTQALAEDPAQRPGLAKLRGELRELLGLPPAPVESLPPPAPAVKLASPAPSRPQPIRRLAPPPPEESTLILPKTPDEPLFRSSEQVRDHRYHARWRGSMSRSLAPRQGPRSRRFAGDPRRAPSHACRSQGTMRFVDKARRSTTGR